MGSLPVPYSPDPKILKTVTPLWVARGGWVTDISAIDYAKTRALGVKVLYVESTDHNISELHSYGARLRVQYGFNLVGWSPVRDDPIGDAKQAALVQGDLGLDGWVSDHEAWTEAKQGNSEQWLTVFRAVHPTSPLMLSCLPGPRPATLAPRSWLNAGADISPQCYQGEVGATGAVAWSATYWLQVMKLPRVRVHPSLGVDKNSHPWSLAAYVNDMKQWGLGGYSLWHLGAIAPAGV